MITEPIILNKTGERIARALERISNQSSAVLGVKRALSLDVSTSAWDRTDDAGGLVANATHDGAAVINDFDSIYPWSDIVTVNYSRTLGVVARYGDTNFSFTPVSGIEVMTYIPAFYWKRWRDSANEYIQISKDYFEGAHFSEEFYIARYTISSGTRSVSGVASTVNTTIATFRANAQAIGSKWGLLDYHIFLIQMLYLVEYADNDAQTILGLGFTDALNTAQLNCGGCDTLGMKSGCLVNDGKHAVIYRGIENIYGNIWQFIDGITTSDKRSYICYEPSEYENEKTTAPYEQMGYTNAATTDSYIKQMGFDSTNPMVMLPTTVGGSSSTFYCDNYWCDNGLRVAPFGGGWDTGAKVGMFCWYLNYAFRSTNASLGSRLLLTI